jgi:repressor LexA
MIEGANGFLYSRSEELRGMKELGNRLRILRITRGMTQNDMAKLLGVTRQTWQAWEAGTNTPRHETLIWLANYFQKSIDYLLEGKSSDKTVSVKILGVIKAGEAILAVEDVQQTIEVPESMIEPGSNYFALKVIGDSMQDLGIREGMTVLVRKQDTIEDGDIAVVMVDEENATIKKVYRANGYLILIPGNPRYKEQKLPAAQARILGKIRYAITEF